jgi:glucuronoxylan 4-O-methyltransferase
MLICAWARMTIAWPMNIFKKLKYFIQQVTVDQTSPSLTIKELKCIQKYYEIQIDPGQLFEIIQIVRPPVNFLVFGTGRDSAFWVKRNLGGRTVFIEDNHQWFDRVKRQNSRIEAYLVNYNTKRTDWKMYLQHPLKLQMELPAAISETKWDVILVDGPTGFRDDHPGRMKSIYMASRLIKPGGHIFLHDCNREIEQQFGDRFLGTENLISQTGPRVLRHYKMS